MAANDDDQRLRIGPEGLSMPPGSRRGRVRLTLSPAEERKRLKELERTEQMLTQDLRMASALLEMIEHETLPREGNTMSPKQIQCLRAGDFLDLFQYRNQLSMVVGVGARVGSGHEHG